jgi:hypothetical protein
MAEYWSLFLVLVVLVGMIGLFVGCGIGLLIGDGGNSFGSYENRMLLRLMGLGGGRAKSSFVSADMCCFRDLAYKKTLEESLDRLARRG